MENVILLHRKESLILTTIDVINEFGIQGVSTKEIARRQGVSEATIFKHFKTKNDLLLAVFDYFSQYDEAIVKSIGVKNLKPIEAILYFFDSYTTYYENYPAITAIQHTYDVAQCDTELSLKANSIFTYRYDFIIHMINEAKKAGEIHEDIESEQLAAVLSGTAREISLQWRILKYSFSLKSKTMSALRMLLA